MATRLFLRSATATGTGLPTTEQHVAWTSDKNAEAQSINRTLSTTKGLAQTFIQNTSLQNTVTNQYYFTKFVSDPLNMSSISANTWTINIAATTDYSQANFPNAGAGPLDVNIYVWRPSNSTKVGTIFEGQTATNVDEATATERVKKATFSGSAVSGMVDGDRIVYELWVQTDQSLSVDAANRFYYNGTTENNTAEASVSNHASFVETPQNLTFSGAGGGSSLVSQISIHKYNVLSNTPLLVSATSTHKYHVSPKAGFTLFSRLFIPYANNEELFGRRSTLFSKIDTDQVDSAYSVQMDDEGNMYWFVRSAGRESWIKASGIVDPQIFNSYDFTNLDYNSSDYYTQDNLPPLPFPIPFVDVAFTYAIADGRMQIIKNGVVASDTDGIIPVQTDMMGRWLLDEGSGLIANNRVPGGIRGTITGATWTVLNGRTYLTFDGASARYVSIPSTSYPSINNITEITFSLWYYPLGLPAVGTFDFLIFKNWSAASSFISYTDNPSGTHRFVWALKNDANVTFSIVSSVTPVVGNWYHVVLRWKSGFAPTITVNNVKSTGATPGTAPLNSPSTVNLTIGQTSTSAPHGHIRDVCHWNRELSDAEVTAIYNRGEVYPLTRGMVGHWLLNEGGDIGNTPVLPTDFLSIVRNSVRLTDARNGTIFGASWINPEDAPHESYLSFSNANDHVAIDNYAAIQAMTEFTVSCWFYLAETNTTWEVLVCKNASLTANTWLLYYEAPGRVRLTTWDSAGVRTDAEHPTQMVAGNWYHVVGRFKVGTAKIVNLNNNKFVGSVTAGTTLDTGSTQLFFGRNSINTPHGNIYDVRIWNRQLTDAEVTDLYNQGRANSGFPAWHKDPDPPPDVPVPITNPFIQVYNVSTPTATNQELVRLHAVVATGFDEKYNVGLGSSVAPQNPPFATLLDQPPTGGGGGGGAPSTDYDVSHSASSHVEFEDGVSRVAVQLDSGAASIGRVVTKVTFRGRRYGSDALGTVTCKIWKSDNSVAATIGSTSATGWSSSDGDQATFTNTGNTYTCVQGDKIGFEISWTPDSNDSIEAGQNTNAGNGYSAWQYDGAWSDAGNIDIAMKIESGSASGGTDVNIVWPPFNETCFGCPAGANGLRSYGIRIPSGSTLIGKKPTKVTFHLRKVGSPTGNLICYIQQNGGATSVQFGAPLDVSTLTGTLTAKEFINTTNGTDTGYALKVNDRIYFNWQSANTANYVVTQRLTGTTVGNAIETAYGDSDPAPTSTIMGWFNTNANDACIKVEEGGFTTSAKDPWFELNNVNTKVGERLKTTGSPLNNQKITRVTVRLKAIGGPTGSIFVKIRDASNTERAQIGIIDASMVSTIDFEDYTATNIYQGFVLQDEWGIFLEYTGGDAVNKILVNVKHEGVSEIPPDSAANSVVVVYSGAYTEVAADLSGKMFIGGSATDPAARLRVGEKVALDTSGLRLKKISRAELQIKRTGSTVPGSVFLRIRDPEDDSIMANIGEVEAMSITPSMSTITFTKIPVSVVGIPTLGILTVEYDNGDDNNYVEVMTSKVNAFDDTAKTYLVKYDALLGAYETTFTAYDLVGKLEEGGDTFTPSADEIPPPEPPTYDHDLLILAGGYPWGYDDEPQNWLNAVPPDVRIYWKLLTLQELTNIYINRIDRQNISYGDVARTGYFSMPEQA